MVDLGGQSTPQLFGSGRHRRSFAVHQKRGPYGERCKKSSSPQSLGAKSA
jgi:hypothetical protein